MINIKREHQWGALAYAQGGNDMSNTKQPHFTCVRCDDGKFWFGGYSHAIHHTMKYHPEMSLNVRIEMRWPVGVSNG